MMKEMRNTVANKMDPAGGGKADCRKVEDRLADLLLDEAAVPATLRAHLAECPGCAGRLNELRATMGMLDEWTAPEVTPYFDGKLAARLREEKAAAPAGWLERLQARLMFGSNLQMKSAAAVAAIAVVLGAGSYAGISVLHQSQDRQTVSATVNDLQILDRNEQVIHQLDVLDEGTEGGEAQEN